MEDEWQLRPATPARHELGADLSAISVDELGERVGMLQAEIARLEAEIARKRASREAASGAFRI